MGDRLELKANLLRVAKLEPEPTRAEKLRDLARQAADYLSQVDYDAYFDTLIPPSGKQEKEFTEFSLSALKESKKNLEAFLLLADQEQVEAARNQVSARSAFFAAPEPRAEEAVGDGEAVGEPAAMAEDQVAAEDQIAALDVQG